MYSSSVGNSLGCIIPSSYLHASLGKPVGCIIISFLLTAHQLETLVGVLFLALTVNSVGNCGKHYS